MFRRFRVPAHGAAASQGIPAGDGPLRPAARLAAVLILLTFFLRFSVRGHWHLLAWMAWEWVLWMPLAVVIGMSVIVLRRGRPKGTWNTVGFVALNLLLLVVAWLSWRGELLSVSLPLLDVGSRLAIAACWIGALGGAVAFPLWLLRRDRTVTAPTWVRCWFAMALFIVLAEAGTRMLERPAHTEVRLPDHWSPRDDSDQEFRIAAIGGSTMLGFPYEPKVDIPTVCAAQLELLYPDWTFTVDNVAVGGINLRTAITRLETLESKPDVILLYTGHNEVFYDLEADLLHAETELPVVDDCVGWSSTYRAVSRLAATVRDSDLSQGRHGRTLFDAPMFPGAIAEMRLARFRKTLVDFAHDCRRQDIRTIWFVPAAGEGTFEPNRSWSRHRIGPEQQESIEGRLADGRRLEQSGRWQDAEGVYRDLLARHPDFAEFHYRLAESLVEQGEFAEAKASFRAAIDSDGFPCQAPSEYRQCLIDVGRQEQIPLIDAETVLSEVTAGGMLDRAVFHDNVHPTLAGYFALGRAAATSAVGDSLVDTGTETVPVELEPLDYAGFLADQEFKADDLAIAYERIAFALEKLALRRYDPSRRRAESAQYRLLAEQLRSGEIQPGEQGTESLSRIDPAGVRWK